MGLTASSASFKGAGRKRKVKQAIRAQSISLEERTNAQQKRLMEVCLMDKAGLSKAEIARQLNISHVTVQKYLKKQATYFPHLETVDAYRISKQSLIESVESQALQSIATGLVRPDVTLKDSTLAFKILHQSNRLESNQSTQNINNNIQFSGTPLPKLKDS